MQKNIDLVFDPMSLDTRRNMVPMFERFLREDPVHRMPDGRWLICRHTDVATVLTDHHRFRRPHELTSTRHPPGHFTNWLEENMTSMNPPDHTRFRNAVARAFMPKEIAKLQTLVEQTVAELIAKLETDKPFDFIHEFAYPLPIAVICRMMGIPDSDHGQFAELTSTTIDAAELFSTPEEKQAGSNAIKVLYDYLAGLALEREKNPGEDLISILVRHEKADSLTRSEVIHAAITLLIAGHETTTHLLGNGLIALIKNPDQLAKLRKEPTLAANAVDEILRYDPSLYTIFRATNEDVVLSGKEIPANSFLFVSLAAANRDPEVFSAPAAFDIARPNANRHLSFGGGIQLCLGFMVARMEGRIALNRLLESFDGFELDGEPTPRDGIIFKGSRAIPVIFRKRRDLPN